MPGTQPSKVNKIFIKRAWLTPIVRNTLRGGNKNAAMILIIVIFFLCLKVLFTLLTIILNFLSKNFFYLKKDKLYIFKFTVSILSLQTIVINY